MDILRGLGKFFGSLIFTTFLVGLILSMGLVSFTNYDSFKAIGGNIIREQLPQFQEDQLVDLKNFFVFQCSSTDRIVYPIGNVQILLKCQDIRDSEPSAIPDLITNAVADSIYYKEFDCSFIQCVTSGDPENMLIAITNEGNQFYKSIQNYMIAGIIVGLIILLVSIRTWDGRLKGVGFNMVFTGLPFLFVGQIQSFLPLQPPEIQSYIDPIVDSLMSSFKGKFTLILVIGVILVLAGYALSLYLRKQKK